MGEIDNRKRYFGACCQAVALQPSGISSMTLATGNFNFWCTRGLIIPAHLGKKGQDQPLYLLLNDNSSFMNTHILEKEN